MDKMPLLTVLFGLAAAFPVWAQGPVDFPDEHLRAVVEDALWIANPTSADLLGLTELKSIHTDIGSLTGLEHAENLQDLNLRFNSISNTSPLSGLKNLRKLVLNNNQIEDVSALSGLTGLRFLDIHGNRISDIDPLSRMVNLEKLILHDNEISDISALSDMTNLTFLDLFGNRIRELGPISGLTGLETLVLSVNRINDVSELSGLISLKTLSLDLNGLNGASFSAFCGLTRLQRLDLSYNHIADLSGLLCMDKLRELKLGANPLSDQDYCSHLPAIYHNNPTLGRESGLSYPPHCVPPAAVSAAADTQGIVRIRWNRVCNGPSYTSRYQVYGATSANGPRTALSEWQVSNTFVFIPTEPASYAYYWVRTATDSRGVNASEYSMSVQVQGVAASTTLFVDDDAPGDPGPGDPSTSDPLEEGTAEHAFDMIQEAIDAAFDGDRIVVRPGVYYENISFLGKDIVLTGIAPHDPAASGFPVIDGDGQGPALQFVHGEDPNCAVQGFVITRGAGDLAGAIYCQDSSPTLTNCLIVGNRATDSEGAAVYCRDSNALFVHCTIADNVAGALGAGIFLENSDCVVSNSIVWGNPPRDLVLEGMSEPLISYTDTTNINGPGNMSVDPLFAYSGYWGDIDDEGTVLDPGDPKAVWVDGDYHLLSETGRWDPARQAWMYDDVTSPCVDAGNPVDPLGDEPMPHGNAVNMGAYGKTTQGSKSKVD